MKIEHKVKDREKGCPFGHICDECNLYVPTYLQKESSVIAEYDCQINSIALFNDELKQRIVGLQAAVESSRNETVKRQDLLLGQISEAQNARLQRQ